ncbi:MAG: sigma-54-dependent Fis family transcriptional regulator, partial [Phycisphaerales bacterium]|nr:sigma-54-dependent Fis family transcriptional regulator [Phycisphaerales bacterium]
GNVRELENLIERALILNPGDVIEADEWLPYSAPDTNGLSRLEQIERTEIERILKLYRGNLSLVAKELGISRTTLWRRIKDYQTRS